MHGKTLFSLVVLSIAIALPQSIVWAEEHSLPVAHNPASKYKIRYDDWDYLLSSVVMDTGMSDRRRPGRAALRETSTRIRHGNYSVTAFEGNRVTFNEFKEEHRASLLAIRKDLEEVSSILPLEEFSKSEQLAYWLNLHNVAVMYEVANEYPIKKLKSLRSGRKGVWEVRSMSVAGVPTSITDIEDHVVANWNDPLVLYGFFMGTVGGPNIRDHAYTADNVADSLRANAREFINSLRGFRLWSGYGRISDHYELGMRYFPNAGEDIKMHMMLYATAQTKRDLEKAKSFRINNYDWGIADLKNGDFYAGSSFNTSSAALAWFIQATPSASGNGTDSPPGIGDSFINDPHFNQANLGSLSPQTRALLRAVKTRNDRRLRRGEVTVEEFIGGEGGRIERKDQKAPEETSRDGGGYLAY